MSMFEFSNESNKLRKKLNIHKSTVRSVEFDRFGKYLISGSKDKSFKVTDVVSNLPNKISRCNLDKQKKKKINSFFASYLC